MIEIHGGQIRISGSHQLLGAELALAIAGVREYLMQKEFVFKRNLRNNDL